ncbi:FkbM family methyltransferase [Candidatus Pelagibacter sp.]|jgi:FkbM family methyltransferase|nr:FkbM family methyltransferase [Candidatus Pelagibacter sp.]|tara:strand:- start:816 stop:1505 length:690 start_codon:yes stop_codon:yes gene_type:complete
MMFGLFTKLFKKKIKYHEISKFLKPNDLFFDIGAHIGDKSKELIKNNIKVVMVEPQPFCLDQLNKLYSENPLVNIVPKGLGSSIQKMEMSINSETPVISTFAEHWKLGRFSNSKWDKKITVDITTLDELIKKFGNPNYIKIDVEGFEHEVILGLTKKSGIVSFEFTSEFINDAHKSIDHLISLGYLDFNYSLGERKKFSTKWSNSEKIKEQIKENIKKDDLLWGDLYCK